jgi:hypothetical protein
MQVDVVIGDANLFAEQVCDSFRDGTIASTGTRSRQIETIIRGTLAALKCRLIHAWDQGHSTAQLRWGQFLDQLPYRGHGFEFIAVHSSCDQQVWPIPLPDNGPQGELLRHPLRLRRMAHCGESGS